MARVMASAVLVALAACGRLGFDPVATGDGGGGDPGGNDAMFDASTAVAPAPFVIQLAGAGVDDSGIEIATDPDGNLYFAATFTGPATLAGVPLASIGGVDIAVFSTRPDGVVRWSRVLGGPGDDLATAIGLGNGVLVVGGLFVQTADLGGGTLTSAGGRDGFITTFALDGTSQGAPRQIGGPGDDGIFDFAFDSTGNFYVTGFYEDTVDFGAGPRSAAGLHDVFVASFAKDGTHRWDTSIGGSDDEAASVMAMDGEDKVAISGEFDGTTVINGSMYPASGGLDVFIVTLDSATALVDQVGVDGGLMDDVANGLATVPGGIVAVGAFGGTVGEFPPQSITSPQALLLNLGGSQRVYPATGTQPAAVFSTIHATPTGTELVAGYLAGSADFGCGTRSAQMTDGVVVEYAVSGSCLHAALFGDAGNEYLDNAVVAPDGSWIVLGGFDASLSIDGTNLTAVGDTDAFFARIAPLF